MEMENPELLILLAEVKKDQAILHILRYAGKLFDLGTRISEVQQVRMPRNFTHEFLIKLIVDMVDEPYPTAEKILAQIDRYMQGG